MVSAAEQLAANLNFSALAKAEELKKRIWFTLGALLVYRLRHLHSAAGHRPDRLGPDFPHPGGRHSRHVQHVLRRRHPPHGDLRAEHHAVHLGLDHHSADDDGVADARALKKEGEQGRKVINQYTRYLHRLLAAFQSYGIAVGLEGAGNVVSDPGWFFRISTVITLTGGTMFLMWLGEQITSRGIGNGISLIILSGIVAELPPAIAGTLELGRQGALSTGLILVVLRHGGRGDRLHRVHGARAAPAADPVSQTPGRQSHVRGPVLAPAAQAQHLGRHSADLRVLAAAAADDGREFQRRAGPGMARAAS